MYDHCVMSDSMKNKRVTIVIVVYFFAGLTLATRVPSLPNMVMMAGREAMTIPSVQVFSTSSEKLLHEPLPLGSNDADVKLSVQVLCCNCPQANQVDMHQKP